MFSQESVNLFMGGGRYLWYQIPSRGVQYPVGRGVEGRYTDRGRYPGVVSKG